MTGLDVRGLEAAFLLLLSATPVASCGWFDTCGVDSFEPRVILETSPVTRDLHAAAGDVAVGADGTVVVSSGGAWHPRDPITSADLRGVARAAFTDVIVAVGDDGTVIRSEDDGRTWELGSSGTSRHLHAVVFVGSMELVAVGDAVILRSDDRGVSWREVPPARDAYLRGLAVDGDDVVWAVGLDGRILRSVDHGQSFGDVVSGTSVDLFSIAFDGAELNRGAIAGASGTLLRSDDDGDSWVRSNAEIEPATLRSVSWSFGDLWVFGDSSVAIYFEGDDEEASELELGQERLTAAGDRVAVGRGGSIGRLRGAYEDRGCDDEKGFFGGGRPFVIAGAARVAPVHSRDGWDVSQRLGVVPADPALRQTLAAQWAADATAEHASVASFARFALELMAVGAPADLLEETAKAMNDEVRHARLCFGLAGHYGSTTLGPGALPIDGALHSTVDRRELAIRVAVEGCVGETLGALWAVAARDAARCPAVRAALDEIAADETRHAALAWRALHWLLENDDDPSTRVAVHSAIARPYRVAPGRLEDDRRLNAWGRLSDRQRQALADRARDRILLPMILGAVDASRP